MPDSVQAKAISNPYVTIHSLYDPSREIASDLESRVSGILCGMPVAIQPIDSVARGSKPNGTIARIENVEKYLRCSGELERNGLRLPGVKPVNLSIHQKNGPFWRNTKSLAVHGRRRRLNVVHIRGFDPAESSFGADPQSPAGIS
jgi:hypothetical protein